MRTASKGTAWSPIAVIAALWVFTLALLLWALNTPAAPAVGLIALGLAIVARPGTDRALLLAMLGGSGFVALLGAFVFTFPPQVRPYAASGVNPLERLIPADLGESSYERQLPVDVWGPRYAAVYPAVALSQLWSAPTIMPLLDVPRLARLEALEGPSGTPLDEAFTMYGALLLGVEAFALTQVWGTVVGRSAAASSPRLAAGALLWLIVNGIATQMNGRLVPAHLGMALLLWGQVRWIRQRKLGLAEWCLITLGFLLTGMTSGTIMVGLGQIVLGSLFVARSASPSRVPTWLALALPIVPMMPFINEGLFKNVQFFEGEEGAAGSVLEGLLQHGLGAWLWSDPPITVLLVFAALLIGAVYWRWALGSYRARPHMLPLLISPPIAVAGGLFGYSTLTMMLPSAELLTALTLSGRWLVWLSPSLRRPLDLRAPLPTQGR